MQLHLERPDFAYSLRGADGRRALVNERSLDRSFVLAPDRLIEGWDCADVASMPLAALRPLLALQPEIVLLGSGDVQRFPPAEVLATCLTQGIGLEAMTNAAAARTFNVLAAEGRRVAAGFVLGGE